MGRKIRIQWYTDIPRAQRARIYGKLGPVYRLLRVINEDVEGKIASKATVRIETPPGDQAQFDWSPYEMEIYGRTQTVNCFSLILSCSRKKAICFSLNADADSIYEAIQELFDDLGGVTQELLIDNPKALVIENNPKSEDEVRYNPQALLMAKHLGTELNACPCYWPRKKGKVENPFRYIEEQFVKGRSFATMEELNAAGKRFVEEWNNEVHTTTKRIPNEHYLQEEKDTLLPVPKTHFFVSESESRKVSNDSLVSIRGSKYSVPVKYATKTVSFRIVYGFRILIYDKQGEQILSVEKSQEKGITVSNSEHYAAIARKTSTSIPQIRRDFTEIFKNGKKYLDAAGRRFDQPTHHARKILELRDLYDTELLDYFIGLAVTEDSMDITHFKALLKEKSSDALKHLSSEEKLPADESIEEAGTLRESFSALTKIPLLIIDELSYLKMDKEKESLFFQVVRQRYEKSSLIITTNLPMGRWDEMFTGKIAATAILDRLVHHCHVLSITGESYRVKGEK